MALVAVGWLVVGGEPRSTAFASDPILDAKAKQAQLQSQLSAQKAQLASLRFNVFSPAPVYIPMEEAVFADSMQHSLETLGSGHPFVKAVLEGRSPAEAAKA